MVTLYGVTSSAVTHVELIVLLTNGAVWSPMNILAFWKVR